jgi:NitT/TauT family transport system substrate-binding protein
MSIATWLSIPDRAGLAVPVPQDVHCEGAPVVNKVDVVRGTVLESRGAEVEAVIRALIPVSRDYAETPGAWAEAMQPWSATLSEEALNDLAASCGGGWSVNGGLSRPEQQFTEDWLMRTDDFAGATPPPLDGWVDFTFVDAALDDLGPAGGADPPAR